MRRKWNFFSGDGGVDAWEGAFPERVSIGRDSRGLSGGPGTDAGRAAFGGGGVGSFTVSNAGGLPNKDK